MTCCCLDGISNLTFGMVMAIHLGIWHSESILRIDNPLKMECISDRESLQPRRAEYSEKGETWTL